MVYNILKKHGHVKAAESVKKTAKAVVVLKDELLEDTDSLEDVITFWKAKDAEPYVLILSFISRVLIILQIRVSTVSAMSWVCGLWQKLI